MPTQCFDLPVTEEHLRRGDARFARHCPLVLSLQDMFGGEWLVVPWGAFQMQQGSWEAVIRFPPELMTWIEELDRQASVEWPHRPSPMAPRTWHLERTLVASEREREPVDWTVVEVA